MWLSNRGGISLLNYNDIKCFSDRNYTQKAEAADSQTHICQYISAFSSNVKYSYRENMHAGNLLFIRGCFSRDLPLVCVTDVTNHLCAKLLGQHLVRDAHNWHLNTAARKPHKLNRAFPFPTLLTPRKTITPFFFFFFSTTSLPSKKKKRGRKEG